MKNLCICLVVVLDAVSAILFARWIYKRKCGPALSTWLMLFLAGGLSLWTYAIAEEYDFASGVMNTADVALSLITFAAILLWSDRTKRFKPFDGIYFALFATVVLYRAISGDAWKSNILTQVLLVIGYGPTFHALFKGKKNTEPISAWACVLATGIVALCPAVVDGNMLAVIYAGRNIVLVSLLLAVMAYYELRERRKP